MTIPTLPSPAATVVLLRDRPAGGLETLLTRRHTGSRFAGGDYVFPGGKVEADDMPEDVERFLAGLTGAEAAQRLGGTLGPREALAYWVAAIREVFEEVGVLLAYGTTGALLAVTPENRERLARQRAACQSGNRAFFEMLREERLTLATDRLVHFAHWITPEESPLRFDTRFFAAPMPAGQEAEADGRETVATRWLAPGEALEALERREISLRLPTIKNLELLRARSAADALEALRARTVAPIRPRILTIEGRPVPVLPDDPRWY
jgi:8-oxo-dGTP pyrophosphatase MutT (NUDIX family)